MIPNQLLGGLLFEIVDVANRYLKMTKLHFFLLGVHSLYLDAFFNRRLSHQTLQKWILLVGVLRSFMHGHFLNTEITLLNKNSQIVTQMIEKLINLISLRVNCYCRWCVILFF